jgi:hypothetical protein
MEVSLQHVEKGSYVNVAAFLSTFQRRSTRRAFANLVLHRVSSGFQPGVRESNLQSSSLPLLSRTRQLLLAASALKCA